MLTALDIIFIGDSGLLLNLIDLFMHLDYGVLGEEDLLAHYIDFCLHILVAANGVIQMHFLVGQQVIDMSAGDLLLVKVFL
jgi:hypothetical protein